MTTVATKESLILDALKTRLLTIKKAAGYACDLQDVSIGSSGPGLDKAQDACPYIDVIQDVESYKHGASGHYECKSDMLLFTVMPKNWDDGDVAALKRDIRKALFGGTSDATGNTGSTLGGTVTRIELVNCKSDLNMVQANRVIVVEISVYDHRVTYRD